MTTLDENGRVDLTGFEVNAADGPVGTVDKATYDIGREFLVVSAGWTRSRAKRVLPAGVVRDVDARRRKVLVSCTRIEFEAAPDYDRVRDTAHRWPLVQARVDDPELGQQQRDAGDAGHDVQALGDAIQPKWTRRPVEPRLGMLQQVGDHAGDKAHGEGHAQRETEDRRRAFVAESALERLGRNGPPCGRPGPVPEVRRGRAPTGKRSCSGAALRDRPATAMRRRGAGGR